ncbi:DUF6412 domain-containing protein [Kribbella sp. NPDC026611]|uniref:DUF6412 domain-containing protein n=1 Tax=Kribbella sp. NPDC026611 TaxID=3154911 RepID=UPI0033EC11A4
MTQWIGGVLALLIPVQDTALLAAAVLTAAALLFTLLLVARASAPTATPLVARTTSVRHRAARSVFLRLRDPDAAGRPRPRAPGQ